MKKLLFVSLILFSTLSFGARKVVRHIQSYNLSDFLADNKEVVILDVNDEDTRKREGMIPGAKLLSSPNKFNVKKELPKNKEAKLVFYALNAQSEETFRAAERAMASEYKNLYIFDDGIQGWKALGKPVTKK